MIYVVLNSVLPLQICKCICRCKRLLMDVSHTVQLEINVVYLTGHHKSIIVQPCFSFRRFHLTIMVVSGCIEKCFIVQYQKSFEIEDYKQSFYFETEAKALPHLIISKVELRSKCRHTHEELHVDITRG